MMAYPNFRNLYDQIETAQQAVADANAAVAALDLAVDDVDSSITTITPLIAAAQSAADAAQSAADSAMSAASGAQSAASTAQTTADNLGPLVSAAQAAANAAADAADPTAVVQNMQSAGVILDGPNSTFKVLLNTTGTDTFGDSLGSVAAASNQANVWRGISFTVNSKLIRDGKIAIKWQFTSTSSSYTQAKIMKNGVNVWYSGTSCASFTRTDEFTVTEGDVIWVGSMCETNSSHNTLNGVWYAGTVQELDISGGSVV